MKKLLLSAITALAFLFGFASCSGDLHDAQIIDLTGYCIIGSVLEAQGPGGWEANGKAPLVYNEADGTYSATATATGTGQNSKGDKGDAFAIIQIGDSSWATAYRLAQPKSEGDSAPVFAADGGTCQVYQGQSADCMVIPGTEEGDKINILVKPSTTYIEVTVTLEKGAAPALPTPYLLDGYYLVGCTAIGFNNFSFSSDNLIWGANIDKTSGDVVYVKDFSYTPCSDDWHENAEAAVKLSTSDWKNSFGKTALSVGNDFVALEESEDNILVSGLVAGNAYRFAVITHPDKTVAAKIITLKKVTPTVKVTGLPDEANGKVLYFTGDFNGWVEPGNTGSIECTVTNGSVEIDLPEIALEGDAGEKEYNVKFASAGWSKPEITGGIQNGEGQNAQFTVTSEKYTVIVEYVEDVVLTGKENPNENGVQYICDWSVE